MILTTMKHTFLLFTTVKCYVSGRVELMQKLRCPIDVLQVDLTSWGVTGPKYIQNSAICDDFNHNETHFPAIYHR